jgi:hypothetical protein
MMKKRIAVRKPPYREGSWFALPLEYGGYAVGRVARRSSNGKIIAYLFGPLRTAIPTLEEVEPSKPEEAVKIWQVGDLGLLDGSWPIIGDSINWERNEWPIPNFIRRGLLNRVAWRVTYSDDDPSEAISQERIAFETSDLEPDGLYGAGATEGALAEVLRWSRGWQRRRYGRGANMANESRLEQAVLVHLKLSNEGFGTDNDREAAWDLEDKLIRLIEATKVGEFDGTETGEGEHVLFMYGPDADKLFGAVGPVIRASAVARGGYVVKRYGGPGTREERVNL